MSPFWTAKNVTIPSYPLLEDNNWFSEETEPNSGCLPFTKTSREIRLETWSSFSDVPVENVWEQRNTWKGSPVFPEGKFQTQIRVPFHQSNLCYQFKAFAAVFGWTDLYNGKRDSGTLEIYQSYVLRTIYPNHEPSARNPGLRNINGRVSKCDHDSIHEVNQVHEHVRAHRMGFCCRQSFLSCWTGT